MPESIQVGAERYGDGPVYSEGVDAPRIEVMETLMYRCVTWTLGMKHSAVLENAHRKLLFRVIGFDRQQRTDHRMSYAKVLKGAHCEGIETVIC